MTTFLTFLLLLSGLAWAGDDEAAVDGLSRPELDAGESHEPLAWRAPAVLIVGVSTYTDPVTPPAALDDVQRNCRGLWVHFDAKLQYPTESIVALCDAEQTTRASILEAGAALAGSLTGGQPLVVIWIGYGDSGSSFFASDSTIFTYDRLDDTELSVGTLVEESLRANAPEESEIVFLVDAVRDPGDEYHRPMHGPTASAFASYDNVLAYSVTRGEAAKPSMMYDYLKQCLSKGSDTIRADNALDAAELGWCLKRAGAASGVMPEFAGEWREQTLTRFKEPEQPPALIARTPLLKQPAVRWGSFAVGAAAALGGSVTHAFAVKHYGTFADPTAHYDNKGQFDYSVRRYDQLRIATYGLYGLAAVGFGVGTASVVLTTESVSVSASF